ncbi:helix-turn-helix transcriptional regulator [Plantactinospora endophytica]|uniref:Transcriptional regulator n=1 Tax=Plantactinospora endophytica TaxID=673535 RepID=A0ABQ4E0G5_9ACTN|nr:WYL domain-containing protein [Plantactinospora endophytica]GIG88219.1 transcriptional regulator [Plantactinospora endophytica]
MRADRLLSIALLLQSRGRLTARQLATELEVSVRTIYRDVLALGTAGIPVYGDANGYCLVDGYQTQLTGLTPDEARGLVLTGLPGAAADLGLAEAVAAAQLKLTAALPAALRERADRMRQVFHLDSPGWYHDGDSADQLAVVADAVWRQRVVTVRYENWTRIVDRRLEPYGLVLKAGRWYLVARAERGVRTFRVNHIRHLSVLAEGFDRPAEFDLAAYWRAHVLEFRARLHQGEALARFAPGVLDQVSHLLGNAVAAAVADGEPQPDGWILARVPIESDSHAERQFLRLGAEVEVLAPESLRQRLAATVAGLAALYPLSPTNRDQADDPADHDEAGREDRNQAGPADRAQAGRTAHDQAGSADRDQAGSADRDQAGPPERGEAELAGVRAG